jgi:hypothetical protein
MDEASIVEALQALDSHALAAVAAETGISERSLWRFRGRERAVPERLLIPLGRALGLK